MDNLEQRNQQGIKSGIIGIFTNLILFMSKIGIGLVSGSNAILADGFNNLSDFMASIITIFGFKMSAKPADHEHPFGHERFEVVSGFVMSLLMMYLGIEVFRSSLDQLFAGDTTDINLYSFLVLVVSVVAKGFLYVYYLNKNKTLDSEVLRASAEDSRNDVLVSIVILIGLGLQYMFELPYIDSILGMGIAVFIMYSSFLLIRDFVNDLIGRRPSDGLIEAITDTIKRQDRILGYHDLIIHTYGRYNRYASVHVELPHTLPLLEAHEIIDSIERDVKRELGVDLLVHLDPVDLDDMRLKNYQKALEKVLHAIDSELIYHDMRLIHEKMMVDIVVPEQCEYSDKDLKKMIVYGLKERGIVDEIQIQFDRNYIK